MENIDQMKITSTSSKGNFKYEKNKEKIIELTFTSWMSNKATAIFKSEEIKFIPKNAWGKKYKISKNNEEIGSIVFDWKDIISISFKVQNQAEYSFKMMKKGFWKSRFELTDLKKNILITLQPKMNWKKMSNDYIINCESSITKELYFDELILYCGFSASLLHKMMSASSVSVG